MTQAKGETLYTSAMITVNEPEEKIIVFTNTQVIIWKKSKITVKYK